MTAEKILLVDDDPNILDGYRRSLSREFLLETAEGGQRALDLATESGPYAVVISDMRMPGMDGIQLLSRIKAVSPDTVRVMLTGNADMETAINAINEGSIFRFLNKPCSKEAMGKTLTAALVQYYCGETASGTDSERQPASPDRGPEPGQPCCLWPCGTRPSLYPSRRHRHEAEKSLAIRGGRDAVATRLRYAGSGDD